MSSCSSGFPNYLEPNIREHRGDSRATQPTALPLAMAKPGTGKAQNRSLNWRHQTLHDFIAFITTFLKSLFVMLKGLSLTANFFYRAHSKISKSLAVLSASSSFSEFGTGLKAKEPQLHTVFRRQKFCALILDIKQLMPPRVALSYCPNSSNI